MLNKPQSYIIEYAKKTHDIFIICIYHNRELKGGCKLPMLVKIEIFISSSCR
jgi:hypothetical protein